jgi:hypothetical protein
MPYGSVKILIWTIKYMHYVHIDMNIHYATQYKWKSLHNLIKQILIWTWHFK